MNSSVRHIFSLLLSSTLLCTSTMTLACDSQGTTGFLPPNNMKIYPNQKGVGGINEAQFNKVMDKINGLYAPVVEKLGQKLVFYRDWQDPTVNAYAEEQTPGEFGVHMFGGLARHEAVTEDAFALVVCHELGHHLGGAPKKIIPTAPKLSLKKAGDWHFANLNDDTVRSWASNEGQADYWGTMKCLRAYMIGDNNSSYLYSMKIDSRLKSSCRSIYKSKEEAGSCVRAAMAGMSLAGLFQSLTQEALKSRELKKAQAENRPPVEIKLPSLSYWTKDKNIVTQMYDSHPASQCRLDTYFQASLCSKSILLSVSNADPSKGVCNENIDKIGFRPRCWYMPSK